jgi:glycerol kinase
MSILVIDVGTSSVRAAVVRPDATVTAVHQEAALPNTPAPGLVELDPGHILAVAMRCAHRALDEAGPVDAVGIANQRASTIVWDRATGEAVGPGLGWQDLRTLGTCLVLQADGIRLAPNASATKLAQLLDDHDPDRNRDLCFGTVDSWLVWHLTDGALHVTDTRTSASPASPPATPRRGTPSCSRSCASPSASCRPSSRRPVSSARPPHSRVHRRSRASPVTSRPRSSGRAA